MLYSVAKKLIELDLIREDGSHFLGTKYVLAENADPTKAIVPTAVVDDDDEEDDDDSDSEDFDSLDEIADDSEEGLNQAKDSMSMQFVDHHGKVAVNYPRNPNGSPDGMTAFTSADGRATIMMPHPERVFRTVQNSWHPKEWQDMGPWFQMFVNARQWVDSIKSGRRR